MYKTNVLNFIINVTGVIFDGDNENDKNKFIRENLPDAMDMFLNQMGGIIPDYKPYYGTEGIIIEEEEPITVAQDIAVELMAKYKKQRKPSFKYAHEAKEYLEEGRRLHAEELLEKYRKYQLYKINEFDIGISTDGLTPYGEYLPERKATSLDFDIAMERNNKLESIGDCLNNLIHFGIMCND